MRLLTFGTLAVTGDDVPADARLQRRQLALLAVLAAEGDAGISRDRLLGLFAADRDPEKARHALDQMLYAARRMVGAEAVVSGAVALQLNGARLPSDVGEFAAALARGDLNAAVALYAGPFLDGVFLTDAPEFERWAEARRAYFSAAFVQALVRLAATASAAGDYAAAVVHLRRAAATEPLSAAVTHALMLALAHAGDQSAALSAARVHAAMVREQLDAQPDPTITTLESELRAGRTPAAPARTVQVSAPAPAASRSSATANVAGVVAPPARRRGARRVVLGAALIAFLALAARRSLAVPGPAGFEMRDLSQVTNTGADHDPALSADASYLAYAARRCAAPLHCTDDLEMREVGGTAARRIIEGAEAIDHIAWSPDARWLIFHGISGGVEGFYLTSALGGAPLPLGPRWAAFSGKGDSLLLLKTPRSDSSTWIAIAGLDAVVRDSIPVSRPRGDNAIEEFYPIPGTDWIILSGERDHRGELRVIDSRGRERDRRTNPQKAHDIRVSRGAVWASLDHGHNSVVVRIPFDERTGRFAAAEDTVHSGHFVNFDVSARGDWLAVDEEFAALELRAVTLSDALDGRLAAGKRLAQLSMGMDVSLSPDGSSVIVVRTQGVQKLDVFRFATIPFDSGAERPIPVSVASSVRWAWTGTTAAAEPLGDSTRLMLLDPVTGARRQELKVGGKIAQNFAALPAGGWVWIASDGQSVLVQATDATTPRTFTKPAWYERLHDVFASRDGRRLVYWGRNPAQDSVRVTVLSLADGAATTWWSARVPEEMIVDWLPDGSLRFRVWRRLDRLVVARMRAPGEFDSLGTITQPTSWVEISADMRRAAVITRETRGDIWMGRVLRP